VDAPDPSGVEWSVSRRWLELPRWRRWRPELDRWDSLQLGGDLLDAGAIGLLVIALLLSILFLGGLPLLLGLAAILVALGGLVIRIAFGRPWLVEARSARDLAWRVRGTFGSRRAITLVAQALERGELDYSPPRSSRVPPAQS